MNKIDAAILATRNSIIQEEIAAIRRNYPQSRQARFEIRNVLALETLSANIGKHVFGRRDSNCR